MRVLVTGATGFIGGAVLEKLGQAGHQVRILLRPSVDTPNLPRGAPVEVGLASLTDGRGVLAAALGMEALVHLAGGERGGSRTDLSQADVAAAESVAEAARQAGVRRLVFLSHLGADRSSAYPLLRAKGEAEEAFRRSGIPGTIVRSALVYGPGDRLTVPLAMTLAVAPGVYLVPGNGKAPVQPLHVDDLATALVWALQEAGLQGRTYEIGGPEVLSWREVVELVMHATGSRRMLVDFQPPALRAVLRLGEALLPRPPFTPFLLDYLATSRTAGLDTLPRSFGLVPRRMERGLDHLRGRRWAVAWLRRQLGKGTVD